jgi:radical SAM protein with 4Fe4S-binding SPASM domain
MPISDPREFFIQWHLTERCNLHCRHCYQTGAGSEELSLAEIKAGLAEIAEMLSAWTDTYQLTFSPSFNVTGGEPFLRRDLFEILAAMGEPGFAVYLLSNGTMIDRDRAEKLAQLAIKGVQISIEGPEAVHDQIRGQGSFVASRRGIEHLLGAGLQVTLNATLSELNLEGFQEMVQVATGLGVKRLGFSRLVPAGRGIGLASRMLEATRIREIYASIMAQETGELKIVTGDPIANWLQADGDHNEDLGSVATGGCAAGISGLTILPDGTVTPCRRLALPLGNVRHDSLREIWAGSEVLAQLRDRGQYRGKCGACPRWAHCRGCRAIAYAHSLIQGQADFLAADPQCFLEV